MLSFSILLFIKGGWLYILNVGDKIGDMLLIEGLGRRYGHRYFKVKCTVCGHIRECGDNNISHAGIYHDIHVCKEDFVKALVGSFYGDYEVVGAGDFSRLKLKCSQCGHVIYKAFNELDSSLKHNAFRCKEDYYKSFIGKEFSNFIIIDFVKKDLQVFFVCKCKICNTQRNIPASKIFKYSFRHEDCIKFLPNDKIKLSILRRWADIQQRTTNPKHPNYIYYGGRGIKCTFRDIVEFYHYFYDGLKADPTLTIDRINVNGDYSPQNTRLVTRQEQQVNKTDTLYLYAVKEENSFLTNNVSEFARHMGYNNGSVANAIRLGHKYKGWKFIKLTKEEFENRLKSVTTNRSINILQEV